MKFCLMILIFLKSYNITGSDKRFKPRVWVQNITSNHSKNIFSQKSTANVRIVKQYRTPLNIKNNLEIFNPNQNQVYLSRKMRHQACQENEKQ